MLYTYCIPGFKACMLYCIPGFCDSVYGRPLGKGSGIALVGPIVFIGLIFAQNTRSRAQLRPRLGQTPLKPACLVFVLILIHIQLRAYYNNFKHLLSFVIPGHDPLCPVYCSFHIYKTFVTHCKTLCLYSWCWGTPVTKVIVSLLQLQICICVNICIFICVCNCICIFALGGTIT